MRLLVAALTASVLLATPAFADGGGSVSTAASFKKCTPPATFPEEGGTFGSLQAGSGVKCTSAASIATAWAKCAAKNGKGGRCVTKVKKHYACAETATTVGTQRTSRVTCKYKTKTVKLTAIRTV